MDTIDSKDLKKICDQLKSKTYDTEYIYNELELLYQRYIEGNLLLLEVISTQNFFQYLEKVQVFLKGKLFESELNELLQSSKSVNGEIKSRADKSLEENRHLQKKVTSSRLWIRFILNSASLAIAISLDYFSSWIEKKLDIQGIEEFHLITIVVFFALTTFCVDPVQKRISRSIERNNIIAQLDDLKILLKSFEIEVNKICQKVNIPRNHLYQKLNDFQKEMDKKLKDADL